MTEDKSKSLAIHHNNSLARVERSIAITNKLLSIIDDTVTDIDGNVHTTVKIGNQTWMAENLKVTHYRNGDPIPTGFSDEEWASLNVGAYCFYDDDPKNIEVYGNLYNLSSVIEDRILAPNGWHIPTHQEWLELVDYLGGAGIIGGILKEKGVDLWNRPNRGALNEVGFAARPGGDRGSDGNYSCIGSEGIFWSTTKNYCFHSNGPNLLYMSEGNPKTWIGLRGFSVRCIKD